MLRVLGPLIFDILSWTLFVAIVSPPALLCGLALWSLWQVGVPVWALPALLPPLVPALLLGLCLCTFLLRVLIPRPQTGKHAFPSSGNAIRWALHFALRRNLLGPPWERWLMGTHALRWAALHALGAKTSWRSMMSSDVAVLDGWGLEVGPDSMIGAECTVTAHMILGPTLVVAPTIIGARTLVLAGAKIGFGVKIDDDAIIGPLSNLRPYATVGSGTRLGMQVDVGSKATIGANVRVGDRAVIAAGAVVPDDTVIAVDARVPASDAA